MKNVAMNNEIFAAAFACAAPMFAGCETGDMDTQLNHYGGDGGDITYTVEADGNNHTKTSTAITFTFDSAVTELTTENISLANGTGTAAKGDLSGGGTAWTLGLTSVAAASAETAKPRASTTRSIEPALSAVGQAEPSAAKA